MFDYTAQVQLVAASEGRWGFSDLALLAVAGVIVGAVIGSQATRSRNTTRDEEVEMSMEDADEEVALAEKHEGLHPRSSKVPGLVSPGSPEAKTGLQFILSCVAFGYRQCTLFGSRKEKLKFRVEVEQVVEHISIGFRASKCRRASSPSPHPTHQP